MKLSKKKAKRSLARFRFSEQPSKSFWKYHSPSLALIHRLQHWFIGIFEEGAGGTWSHYSWCPILSRSPLWKWRKWKWKCRGKCRMRNKLKKKMKWRISAHFGGNEAKIGLLELDRRCCGFNRLRKDSVTLTVDAVVSLTCLSGAAIDGVIRTARVALHICPCKKVNEIINYLIY